jgi:signal transduction histidine kinase/CheY-like chemotaxis protein
MRGGKLIYIISAGFILGTILLIYIQFNSTKNINTLINGNQRLTEEFTVSNELTELGRNIVLMDSKIRGVVNTSDTLFIEGLHREISAIEAQLIQLQQLSDQDSSVLYIDVLDTLVKRRLQLSDQILQTLFNQGKKAAEQLIASRRGKELTDSILHLTSKIDSTRKKILINTVNEIDDSGRSALTFNTILTVIVLTSAGLLFWYIINIIRQQIGLIRELRSSEEQVLKSSRIKEEFLANMSHEIRTPLNAILGFTDLLQQKELDQGSKDFVNTIHHSGETLLTLVNDILDLSKIEAGGMRLDMKPFSISSITHAMNQLFLPKALEKGLTFKTEMEGYIPDLVIGDVTRVKQILVNLIGNALKFTEKGEVIVRVSGKNISTNRIELSISISDTGIGIDASSINQIFERFEQGEAHIHRQFGGTGLGLYIVRQLVSLQNGEINVESTKGKGSRFTVTLPFELADETAMQQEQISPSPAEEKSITGKVLIVEDNPVNQQLIRHLLESFQLEITIAGSAEEAIRHLQHQRFQLILMDIQLPGMNGYEATTYIRHTLQLNIPIVAMTANAMSGEYEKCIAAGMNDHLSKPLRRVQLISVLKRYLSETNLQEQEIAQSSIHNYQYIDLGYMKEIGRGNKEYEQMATDLFIRQLPEEMNSLRKACAMGDYEQIKQLTHQLRTTISVMGLNEQLSPLFLAIEKEHITQKEQQVIFEKIEQIATAALKEAGAYKEILMKADPSC